MADYRHLLRRAIAALPEQTGAARRAVYERARSALVGELRKLGPKASPRDITSHRLQLEDDIRVVEQEASEAVVWSHRSKPALPQPTDYEFASDNRRTDEQITSDLQRIIDDLKSGGKADAVPKGPPPKNLAREPATKVPRAETYEVRPLVFLPPRGLQEPDFLSAMMPFSEEFAPVWRAIQRAAADTKMRASRADSIWEDQVVIQDVFGLIFRSRVVVCDFSTKNANVLYETGIAHTLGREVIPIVQDLGDLPFDLRHHRFLVYKNTPAGRSKLRKELAKRLAYIQQHSET